MGLDCCIGVLIGVSIRTSVSICAHMVCKLNSTGVHSSYMYKMLDPKVLKLFIEGVDRLIMYA